MNSNLEQFSNLRKYQLVKVIYKNKKRFAKFLRISNDEKGIIVQICSGEEDLFKEVKLTCRKVLTIC